MQEATGQHGLRSCLIVTESALEMLPPDCNASVGRTSQHKLINLYKPVQEMS